jgi:GT2 family glycosyltransferase
MSLSKNNFTIVIVTFKSEKVIETCLNSIDQKYEVIIVENSKDASFKKNVESKFPNVKCYLTGSNIGMGSANNIGIKLAKTNYVLILNPDVKLTQNTMVNLTSEIELIDNFAIAAPIEITDLKKKNYGFFNSSHSKMSDCSFKVDYVDGFAMLFNKSRFKKNIFFDENIFMYWENVDLCKRTIENNENVYVIPKSEIVHFGAKSVSNKFFNEVEFSRNWHWTWSKFYFNKKHYGYFFALKKANIKLITSIIKYLFFTLTFNSMKKKIYLMRFLGLYNSIIGKKSWYRPNIK